MRQATRIVCLAGLLAACGDIAAEVQSNTSWSGAFGNRSVDGAGNQTIDLPDDPPQCVAVQKDTPGGYLRVRVTVSGGWLFAPSQGSGWVETTAAYGVVTACSDG